MFNTGRGWELWLFTVRFLKRQEIEELRRKSPLRVNGSGLGDVWRMLGLVTTTATMGAAPTAAVRAATAAAVRAATAATVGAATTSTVKSAARSAARGARRGRRVTARRRAAAAWSRV